MRQREKERCNHTYTYIRLHIHTTTYFSGRWFTIILSSFTSLRDFGGLGHKANPQEISSIGSFTDNKSKPAISRVLKGKEKRALGSLFSFQLLRPYNVIICHEWQIITTTSTHVIILLSSIFSFAENETEREG